jgi:hypothetical protein
VSSRSEECARSHAEQDRPAGSREVKYILIAFVQSILEAGIYHETTSPDAGQWKIGREIQLGVGR